MTVTLADYQNLITSQHANKSKFLASVAASLQPLVDMQNLLLGIPALYDVDQAIGVQLDSVGLWVGVSRYVAVPLAAFFSWGIVGLGWGEAIWHQPLTPVTDLHRLDDATYRLLIKARIISNNWDGTIAGAYPALAVLFSGSSTPGTVLTIVDNMNMTMTLTIGGQPPGALFTALIEAGELGLKPVAVRVNYVNASTNLNDDGGVLALVDPSSWPASPSGLAAGAFWSNGGVVTVVPGITPDPAAPPVVFGAVLASELLAMGGGNLPLTSPAPFSNRLWNSGGEVWIA